MSHFVSKLGDLLHFHPLAHPPEARKASDIPEGQAPGDAHGHANGPDDLSHLGLRVGHHESDCCSDLGRFALLASDDLEHQARIGEIWKSVD